MFLRSEFNYDMFEASEASGLRCEDVSLAKQSFAEEVDINTIVRRFGLSGELPVGVRLPQYGDFTAVSDFKSAMDALAMANESFDAMPAHVRARFHNDTHEFVEFVADDRNIAEARKLGLVPEAEVVKAVDLVAPALAPVAPVAAPAAVSTVST